MKSGKAKRLVMQRRYRSQVVRDRTKYNRKEKHRKAPDFGGFSMPGATIWPATTPSWSAPGLHSHRQTCWRD